MGLTGMYGASFSASHQEGKFREDLCSGLVFNVGITPLMGFFVVIFILMGCIFFFFVRNADVDHLPLFVVTAVSFS